MRRLGGGSFPGNQSRALPVVRFESDPSLPTETLTQQQQTRPIFLLLLRRRRHVLRLIPTTAAASAGRRRRPASQRLHRRQLGRRRAISRKEETTVERFLLRCGLLLFYFPSSVAFSPAVLRRMSACHATEDLTTPPLRDSGLGFALHFSTRRFSIITVASQVDDSALRRRVAIAARLADPV